MKGRSSLIKIGMVLLSLALCLGLTGLGVAQEKYPAREITFITGTQAGSANDVLQRALCTRASKILGQNIIVMNKPGAAQALALVAVKNAKPDGYTIGAIPSGAVGNQLMKKVSYDCLKDFTYIIQCPRFFARNGRSNRCSMENRSRTRWPMLKIIRVRSGWASEE